MGTTLCVPTIFIAYTGEALDFKVPLLRSLEAVDKASVAVCQYFDATVGKVHSYLGWEQEYFLVDRAMYRKRKDLIFCGRTLFGARPPKGQEMDDHYFGAIKPRVAEFMADLNEELWKLGILAKTEHNEVAPAQHELAPIYTTTNIATDHNHFLARFRIALQGITHICETYTAGKHDYFVVSVFLIVLRVLESQ